MEEGSGSSSVILKQIKYFSCLSVLSATS
jgi:hypothetical protein